MPEGTSTVITLRVVMALASGARAGPEGASPQYAGVVLGTTTVVPLITIQRAALSRDTANFIPLLPVPRRPHGARPRHAALAWALYTLRRGA
jgi:hypothetical protein